jgi:hypothetical protein
MDPRASAGFAFRRLPCCVRPSCSSPAAGRYLCCLHVLRFEHDGLSAIFKDAGNLLHLLAAVCKCRFVVHTMFGDWLVSSTCRSPLAATYWWVARVPQHAGVISGGSELLSGKASAPAVDIKALHAKIGELTLENDFLEAALGKAGSPSAKR